MQVTAEQVAVQELHAVLGIVAAAQGRPAQRDDA